MYYAKSILTGEWISFDGERALLSANMKEKTQTFMKEHKIHNIEFFEASEVDRDERAIKNYHGGMNPND